MNRNLTATALIIAASLIAGAASARVPTGPRPSRVAHPDVRALVSTDTRRGLWRAMVIVDRGVPGLIVEQFQRGRVAAAAHLPTVQRRIDGFDYAGRAYAFAGHARALEALSWGRRALTFDLVTDSNRLTCRVPVRGPRAYIARCDGTLSVIHDVPRPRPPRVNWAARASVIRACSDAFFGAGHQTTCLDAVRGFRFDPTTTIRACDEHLYGDANALACLDKARRAVSPPIEVLDACDDAMFGDGHTLACLDKALTARYEPTAVIRACDDAMFGDANALECIAVAARGAHDPVATIRACEEAMYGDAAALDCLRRGVSF
ncbi:MAG: hypothetical protein CSA66_01715 [Proteobacteria bacterium]|nr:MAG: hypothetical protein CSA66_01715 [Pseudomonadota bacterium]